MAKNKDSSYIDDADRMLSATPSALDSIRANLGAKRRLDPIDYTGGFRKIIRSPLTYAGITLATLAGLGVGTLYFKPNSLEAKVAEVRAALQPEKKSKKKKCFKTRDHKKVGFVVVDGPEADLERRCGYTPSEAHRIVTFNAKYDPNLHLVPEGKFKFLYKGKEKIGSGDVLQLKVPKSIAQKYK